MEEGPEPQEWVERAAEEQHHGHEHAAEGARPASATAAVTAAVLAVLAALGSLLSGHAANEAILAQSRATNQWAFYQAKSTKGHLYEVGGEVIKALGRPDTTVPDHFHAAMTKYDREKEEIRREAEHLEAESRHELHKHHRYALGVSMFQVGIVLASVSILVRYRPLFALSIAAGAAGLICLVAGFLG